MGGGLGVMKVESKKTTCVYAYGQHRCRKVRKVVHIPPARVDKRRLRALA